MKNKTPLVLAEQLIMILVFAIAAALCLQGFALADKQSTENRMQDQAVIIAQNAAETYKHYHGDQILAAAELNGTANPNGLTATYEYEIGSFELTVEEQPTETNGPERAVVSVYYGDKPRSIFSLPIAWQGVKSDE